MVGQHKMHLFTHARFYVYIYNATEARNLIQILRRRSTIKVFSIEGPIGVGKSTVLSLLKGHGFPVYPEPTKEWDPWLQHFYATEKTANDSIHLQLQIGNSIAKRMDKIVGDGNSVAIVERSLRSGLHVFTEVNQELTPDPEWENCVKFYEDLIVKHETETHNMKFYYLALNCADFEKVYKRSKFCSRPDSFIQVNYHKKYMTKV